MRASDVRKFDGFEKLPERQDSAKAALRPGNSAHAPNAIQPVLPPCLRTLELLRFGLGDLSDVRSVGHTFFWSGDKASDQFPVSLMVATG